MCFPGYWKLLFAVNLPFFSQNSTKLVPFRFHLSLDHCPMQLSGPVLPPALLLKSPASIVMDDGALSNSLHSLSRFLYSFLISFGHFLAWSEVGTYTFTVLMIFFGLILILLILIYSLLVCTHTAVYQHRYQDSRIVEEHRFCQILSSIYGSIPAISLKLQTHYHSDCFSNQK